MFIYVIVCSETLKIYVGQHKGSDLRKYLQQKLSEARRRLSDRSHLYAAMRKHPRESWSIHPLISDLQTREECNHWERVLIKSLKVQHQDIGYNLMPGGEGAPYDNTHGRSNKGQSRSEETRLRQSEAAKRRFADPAERVKHSAAHKGKPMPPRTEGHRQHLSDSLMGRKASAEQILHQSLAQKGKPKPPRTAEHIRNNANAQRGMKRSPEFIAKNRAAHLGLPWSALRRARFEAKRLSQP